MANEKGSANDRLLALLRKQGAATQRLPTGGQKDPVKPVIRRGNAQTGTRDLLLLAISSWFALLLFFVAPLVKHFHSGSATAKNSAREQLVKPDILNQ